MARNILALLVTGYIMLVIAMASCQQQPETLPDLPTPEEYRSWARTTDQELNYPIPGHEDNCRVIYINAVGQRMTVTEHGNRRSYTYPEGTIIVKEVYQGLEPPDMGESPKVLTMMIKNSQHPRALHGWLWIVKTFMPPQEKIITHDFCVDCHANANEQHPYGDKNLRNDDRDFVFFPPA